MSSSVAISRSVPLRSSSHWSGQLREGEQRTRDDGAGRLRAAVEEQQRVGDREVDADRAAVDLGLGPDRHHVVGRALRLLGVQLGATPARTPSPRRCRPRRCTAGRRRARSCARTSSAGRATPPAAKPSSLPIIIAGSGAARSPMISAFPPFASTPSNSAVTVARTSASQLADGPRGEPAGDEVAAGAVHRVVEADDRRVGRDVRPVAALVLVRVDEQVGVLLDVLDVVVAGHAPQLVGGVPVEGLRSPGARRRWGTGRWRRSRRRAGPRPCGGIVGGGQERRKTADIPRGDRRGGLGAVRRAALGVPVSPLRGDGAAGGAGAAGAARRRSPARCSASPRSRSRSGR